MKKYRVQTYHYHDYNMEMTEEEFNKWVQLHAEQHYNMYRIIGDKNSNHFRIDFDIMWEVTVIDEADGNNQK